MGGAQRVSWLELFYDLVFVATIVTFSDAVTEHPDVEVLAIVIPAFAAVWWIWLVTTLLTNRFPVDDTLQRALVLAQMLLLLLTALNVGDGLDHHEGFVSVAYALLCLDVAIMHARHTRVAGPSGVIARARRNEFAMATVLMMVAAVVDEPARYVLWGLALATTVLPSVIYFSGAGRRELPLDEHHLAERLGLLTIIVCGESFVKVALLSSEGNLDSLDYVVMSAMFVLVFAMWWSYFDDIPDAGLPHDQVRLQLWFLAHFCLQVCLIGIAVGYGDLVRLDLGTDMDVDRTLLTVGPVAGALLSLALLGTCTRRRPARPLLTLRIGAALVVALAGVLIAAVDWVDVEAAAVLFAVVTLAQALVADHLRRRTSVAPV